MHRRPMIRRTFSALAGAILTLSLVATVQATITPTSTALAIAQAIAASSVNVTGASFSAVPPSGTPNGVSTSSLLSFPVDGSSFGILTSGDVSAVDQPGTFADNSDGGGNVRGDTDYDVSILKVDVSVPAGVNCLSFNFKFMSEEYPTYVGTAFNDAFIAELDTSDWTTSGSTITAPHNFAFDAANDVVSINSTGIGGMTPANGVGTAFDGPAGPGPDQNGAATVLLGAATPITSGSHSLYLSLFDQGDDALDSAVFLDNLRLGTVPNPATDCKVGAAEPAHLTLTKTVDNTGGGTAAATDWTLSATGPTTISGKTGDASVTSAAVTAGTYTLAESGGPSGYTAGSWGCTGGTLTGSSLVLAAGATASCSIKNTYSPPPPEPQAGLIAHSQASCNLYSAGKTPALDAIDYRVGDGTIDQNLTPGVFTYLSTVVVKAGDTVTTAQSTNNSSGALFTLNSGATVWNSNCKKVGDMTPTQGGATASYTFSKAGTYYLRLQYSAKSIAGTAAPSDANPTYRFGTAINGTEVVSDRASIDLHQKQH